MMPVMAASVAWGGVNAGFLLRAARGAWWCRPGGFWGSGEAAAAPVTAKKFRATGSRPAGEEEAGGPERPGDVVNVVFVDRSGQRIPPSSCLPQGLRICRSIRSAFPPDLLAPSHPSGPDVNVIFLTVLSPSVQLKSPCPDNCHLSVFYSLRSTSHCFVSFFAISPQNQIRNPVCLVHTYLLPVMVFRRNRY
ncbi:ferredoxin-2, mitochondrial isoform X2 [Delphinapterus leucas]|uniref:Ferredoxin-2, mitochondrial isoform X2 n=1 Tax=Delphinapterus leucas TaxID=9749 RepID=A0A2Y9LT57_DELLE|nr:ferredoxin-2, mitochondrial isoform X2 [Delphinapterus leucas]